MSGSGCSEVQSRRQGGGVVVGVRLTMHAETVVVAWCVRFRVLAN